MKQITRIFFALAFIISLASCQSSKSGCYDFSAAQIESPQSGSFESGSKVVFTNVVCKP